MKWPVRKILPLLGVSAVAIVIAFPPGGEQQESAPVIKNSARSLKENGAQSLQALPSQPPAPAAQQAQMGHVELERLDQQKDKAASGKAVANAFNPTSWYVARPVPPPPPPPPPPAPTAPPLPFTYMGRYEDPPKVLVMLAAGSKLYTVAEGDVIDGNYRVERVTDSAVELVYLPLNISQSVSTKGAPVPESTQLHTGSENRYRRP